MCKEMWRAVVDVLFADVLKSVFLSWKYGVRIGSCVGQCTHRAVVMVHKIIGSAGVVPQLLVASFPAFLSFLNHRGSDFPFDNHFSIDALPCFSAYYELRTPLPGASMDAIYSVSCNL